jgi:hypothetical protein
MRAGATRLHERRCRGELILLVADPGCLCVAWTHSVSPEGLFANGPTPDSTPLRVVGADLCDRKDQHSVHQLRIDRTSPCLGVKGGQLRMHPYRIVTPIGLTFLFLQTGQLPVL